MLYTTVGRSTNYNIEENITIFFSFSIILGYLNNPHTTALAVDSEGWLHTGDIGYYDDDGYFYIVDRLKDFIKCRGFQVSIVERTENVNKEYSTRTRFIYNHPCIYRE